MLPWSSGNFVNMTNGSMNLVATVQAHHWKHVSKATLAAFPVSTWQATMEPILNEWIKQVLEPFIAKSSSKTDSGNGLNILYEMNKVTLDMITHGAFDLTRITQE